MSSAIFRIDHYPRQGGESRTSFISASPIRSWSRSANRHHTWPASRSTLAEGIFGVPGRGGFTETAKRLPARRARIIQKPRSSRIPSPLLAIRSRPSSERFRSPARRESLKVFPPETDAPPEAERDVPVHCGPASPAIPARKRSVASNHRNRWRLFFAPCALEDRPSRGAGPAFLEYLRSGKKLPRRPPKSAMVTAQSRTPTEKRMFAPIPVTGDGPTRKIICVFRLSSPCPCHRLLAASRAPQGSAPRGGVVQG